MKKIPLVLILSLLCSNVVKAGTLPTYTSIELIEQAKSLNQTEVIYQGEVIGDVLFRGEQAWLSVSDGVNAIAVYIPIQLLPQDLAVGRYLYKGDTISVKGILHRACQNHGGDLDLHVSYLERTSLGYPQEREFPEYIWIIGGVFSGIALIGANYLKKRHEVSE